MGLGPRSGPSPTPREALTVLRLGVVGLALLSALLSAAPSQAADLLRPAAIYGLSTGVDLGATAYAEARGLREGNPAMADPARRYALTAAQVAALTAVDAHLQARGRRGWARALRATSIVVRGALAVRALRMAHGRGQ